MSVIPVATKLVRPHQARQSHSYPTRPLRQFTGRQTATEKHRRRLVAGKAPSVLLKLQRGQQLTATVYVVACLFPALVQLAGMGKVTLKCCPTSRLIAASQLPGVFIWRFLNGTLYFVDSIPLKASS